MSDRYGQLLASVVWVARRAGMGRQHSATNGCFREAKTQRQRSDDELEETSVA